MNSLTTSGDVDGNQEMKTLILIMALLLILVGCDSDSREEIACGFFSALTPRSQLLLRQYYFLFHYFHS